MHHTSQHSFHIPVMGLGFTVDTPLKVARYGISSVVSIIEDNLIEQMREFYCNKHKLPYQPIDKKTTDYRAKRITAYLNLLNQLVKEQMQSLKNESFESGTEINKYFQLLPDDSFLTLLYKSMVQTPAGKEKTLLQNELRNRITAGSIDVNIMTKCDRLNYNEDDEQLPQEFSDALSALRGFANSTLNSAVVFSAGINPRLYSYCETFEDFYPTTNQPPQKKIIIKVSDFRSALTQGKFLAKKGLLVSEFRIESGLNCGGHAFPTNGLLLGPILEEFKNRKDELQSELVSICNAALIAKGKTTYNTHPQIMITVQGGIGTFNENKFLLEHYRVDATGWGSPFLLVPEVTNVDEATLKELAGASPDDYYISHSSPLGVPFNNFRKSSSEKQRLSRIKKNRPGSPCYKKFLSFNTEFTDKPICVASRQYQNLKINQLKNSDLPPQQLEEEISRVVEKDCLCEGLASSAVLKNKILKPKQLQAVAICPGPNLANFSGIFSLAEMTSHIYGRANILNKNFRPNMFLSELMMYVTYLKKGTISNLKERESFLNNLAEGITYYYTLIPQMVRETKEYINLNLGLLRDIEKECHLLAEVAV